MHSNSRLSKPAMTKTSIASSTQRAPRKPPPPPPISAYRNRIPPVDPLPLHSDSTSSWTPRELRMRRDRDALEIKYRQMESLLREAHENIAALKEEVRGLRRAVVDGGRDGRQADAGKGDVRTPSADSTMDGRDATVLSLRKELDACRRELTHLRCRSELCPWCRDEQQRDDSSGMRLSEAVDDSFFRPAGNGRRIPCAGVVLDDVYTDQTSSCGAEGIDGAGLDGGTDAEATHASDWNSSCIEEDERVRSERRPRSERGVGTNSDEGRLKGTDFLEALMQEARCGTRGMQASQNQPSMAESANAGDSPEFEPSSFFDPSISCITADDQPPEVAIRKVKEERDALEEELIETYKQLRRATTEIARLSVASSLMNEKILKA
ncbi:uncharacterized protein EV422DRAFT_311343 [Fimicolochytrium jonesii]|uniref:uncharacterized protein n=1 Tax=Fimicolochytrium jonesii TaxID=1396493 RepID=UPI0022FDD3FC|nr:uncharacterized protein EV422DRAFT_311343 [Fimicolochytrium jonesii]KAI8824204.1 hypothetical protein EV422DRAFT_311343 [Fimicolochytrium jonesii]